MAAFSGDKDSMGCLSTVLENADPERIHLAEVWVGRGSAVAGFSAEAVDRE